ncbi:MAG: efflux RND transporter periplasmic adaptor subunit [Myxococcales bacterium]|nr:MAG: efflux RND transporter periplasmic adaptor subunit [Myxococcales bacterium]
MIKTLFFSQRLFTMHVHAGRSAAEIFVTCIFILMLGACSKATSPKTHNEPATVKNPIAEADLPRVELSAAAAKRLGIKTARVQRQLLPEEHRFGGEVMVPPGKVLSVTAPIAGMVKTAKEIVPGMKVSRGDVLLRLVPFAPVARDLRAGVDREVQAAQAQLSAAESRLNRTQTLVTERAAAQRALEEATAARDVAKADLDAAHTRAQTTRSSPLLSDVAMTVRAPSDGIVGNVSVAPSQAVTAGTPLLEVVAVDAFWVRVPVYSADLHRIDPMASARVSAFGVPGGQQSSQAKVIAGPPSSNPLVGTVDRYYALAPSSTVFRPGERVMVSLRFTHSDSELAVPFSSIIYDANGLSWLYMCDGPHRYRRTHVEVKRKSTEFAVLGRGPKEGSCVASIGVNELYGSEFPPGH